MAGGGQHLLSGELGAITALIKVECSHTKLEIAEERRKGASQAFQIVKRKFIKEEREAGWFGDVGLSDLLFVTPLSACRLSQDRIGFEVRCWLRGLRDRLRGLCRGPLLAGVSVVVPADL